MIFHAERLIFVHIQKTGGDSIVSAFNRNPDCSEKHFVARELRALYGADVWDSYFKFAFVRNPWDRLVSWWTMTDAHRASFQAGARLNKFQTFVLERARSFHEFLENCDEDIVDVDGRKWIYRNQLDYITDDRRRCMVDFVGRFESIQADFCAMTTRVFNRPILLPHINRSRHSHYKSYYTTTLAEKVSRRFERDITTFGYTFD